MVKQRVAMVGVSSGVVAGLLWVMLWLGVAAADTFSLPNHSGEELYDRALLRVDIVADQIQLRFGRPEPGLLAPGYTMSYCGKELAPTLDNLRSMIGKPCRGWAYGKKMSMAYHRLEFQCQ